MLGLGISGAALIGTLPLMGGVLRWWHDDAVLDADFSGGHYRHDGAEGGDPLAFLTVSRSAPALTYAEQDGVLVGFAANAPRISGKGLLIEGQKTNLIRRSQDFSTTWAATAVTLTGAAGVAPDGTTSATRLSATSATNLHLIQQSGVAVSANPHTVSIYVKPDGYHKFGIREGAVAGAWATFDLRGEGEVMGASTSTGAIRPMADGWYRVSMTYAGTDHEHGYQLFLLDDDYLDGSPLAHTFAGDGASGALLWGAQVEQGGFATSYIPTGADPVTRQADLITLTGAAAAAITDGEATILAITPAQGHPAEGGARIIGTDGPVPLNTGSDGQVQNYNGSSFATSSLPFSATYSGNEVWSITGWSSDATVVMANGGTPANLATGMSPISTVFVGSSNGGNALNGYLSRLTLWSAAKTTPELEALSALGQSFDATAVIAWGDSLTSGNQDGSGVTWPSALSTLGVGSVYNNGVGGETSSQVLARFLAFPSGFGSRTVIAMGRNNFETPLVVEGDIATAVASLTTDDFLVLGILPSATDNSGQKAVISALNAELASTYGARFVDCLEILQAASNDSSGDVADVAAGNIPESLRTSGDPLHLNAEGYSAMAAGIRAAITANGW